MPPTPERVLDALEPVIDPELGASIVDLGLVYSIDVSPEGRVAISFTTTVPECPLTAVIQYGIEQSVGRLKGVTAVEARFVAEPAWNPSMMRPEAYERFTRGED